VNGNLSTIRDISETTTEQANRANQNAGQLVTMASDLRGLLTQFKV
jgi:methyl-accepting chemotaxis protein